MWKYGDIQKKNKDYTRRKEEKKQFYTTNKLKLIEIPFELFNSTNSFQTIVSFLIEKFAEYSSNKEYAIDVEQIVKINVSDYKKQLENIREMIMPYIHDDKYFPSESELKVEKKGYLVTLIKRMGGFMTVPYELGFLPKSKMKTGRKKKNTEERMIEEFINTINRNESQFIYNLEQLKTGINKPLGAAIRTSKMYHKILPEVRLTTNLPTYNEYRILQDKLDVIDTLARLNNKYKYIPSKNNLVYKLNLSTFYKKLSKYLGGYVNAAHAYGYLTEKEYMELHNMKADITH